MQFEVTLSVNIILSHRDIYVNFNFSQRDISVKIILYLIFPAKKIEPSLAFELYFMQLAHAKTIIFSNIYKKLLSPSIAFFLSYDSD